MERDYAFDLAVERTLGSEAWITYENQTTRVTVHYELGAEPWVAIGRLEMRNGQLVQPASIGLDLVLRERGRSLDDVVIEPREVSTLEMSQMVSVRANSLRSLGGDLLRGDFRSFAKLQTKAEKELRRRQEELTLIATESADPSETLLVIDQASAIA